MEKIKIVITIVCTYREFTAVDISINDSSIGDCGTKIHDLFIRNNELAQFINRLQRDEIIWDEKVPRNFHDQIEDERLRLIR